MFGTIVCPHRLQPQSGLEILFIKASVAIPVRELYRHNPGHECVRSEEHTSELQSLE